MILSHKYKFIFLCNGKTGTSSIEKILYQYQEGENYDLKVPGLFAKKHIPPMVLKSILGEKVWNEYFKFCFVRNPWDWFVSQFFYNYKIAQISKKEVILNPRSALKKYYQSQKRKIYLENIREFSTEEIYKMYTLLKQYRGVYDANSLFQSNYVFDDKQNQMVDFVGRFEHINRDFEIIKKNIKLNIDEVIPHINQTVHNKYKSYYNSRTRDLIGSLYKIDIDNFGYSFN